MPAYLKPSRPVITAAAAAAAAVAALAVAVRVSARHIAADSRGGEPGPVARPRRAVKTAIRARPGCLPGRGGGRGITLLVPFRSDGDRRTETWAWLLEYWRHWLPDAEILMGRDDHTPFCKTAAVNSAFARSRGDIIVILDADCYIDASVILGCAAQIRAARRLHRKMWFVPYRHFYRLTEDASRRVLDSPPQDPLRFTSPPPPGDTEESSGQSVGHWFGALITIMPREAFIIAGGMDERFCVDAATEILTRTGWKTHDQVSTADQVLTLNHATGLSEWQPVQAVNVFPVVDEEMLSLESRNHSSVTTLNHRWPTVRWYPTVKHGYRRWATSGSLTRADRIPIAARCAGLPAEPKWNDDLVELVSWFWTEGHIPKLRSGVSGRSVLISQSLRVNRDNCARITEVLTRLFGPSTEFPHRSRHAFTDRPRWRVGANRTRPWEMNIYLNPEAGDLLQELAPGRVPSCEFLLSLTQAQLDLFIQVSMLADGCQDRGVLGQRNPDAAEAFRFACILAGHATSSFLQKEEKKQGYHMTRVRMLKSREVETLGGSHERIRYTGLVWCPTTSNGTWLARRNGKVYFTGNSGWGGEDIAEMIALDTLYCKHHTTRNQVLHLWHPHIGTLHTEREWAGQSSPGANNALAVRYQGAYGRPDRMAALVREDGAGTLPVPHAGRRKAGS